MAHIPFLEVFDDLGLRPHQIAGTSIGSVIGALYASDMKAQEIRERVNNLVITKGDSIRDIIKKKTSLKPLNFSISASIGALF